MGSLLRTVVAGFLDLWSSMMNGFLLIVTGIFEKQFGYDTAEFASMVDPGGVVLPIVLDVFTWTGIGLSVLFLGFGIWKSVFGEQITAQRENPLVLIARFFMAIIVVYFVFDFVNTTIMSIFVVPHSIINSITPPSIAMDSLSSVFKTDFSEIIPSIATMEEFGRIAVGMVVFGVCGLIFITKFLRLFVEMIERYLLMNLLIYSAPLAASTIASPSLSSVFAAWCKMLGGQIILILYNVFSIKLVLTTFAAVTQATFGVGTDEEVTASLFGFLLLFGLLNVAQRFDTYLNQLSINAGITGNMFGGDGALAMRVFDKAKSVGDGFAKTKPSTSGDGGKDGKGAKINDAKVESSKGKGMGVGSGAGSAMGTASTIASAVGGVSAASGTAVGKGINAAGLDNGKPKSLSDDDIRKREVTNAANALGKNGGLSAAGKPNEGQVGAKIHDGAAAMNTSPSNADSANNAALSPEQSHEAGASIGDGVVDINGGHTNNDTHTVASNSISENLNNTVTSGGAATQQGNSLKSSDGKSGNAVPASIMSMSADSGVSANDLVGAASQLGSPVSGSIANDGGAKQSSIASTSQSSNNFSGMSKNSTAQHPPAKLAIDSKPSIGHSVPRRMLENQHKSENKV